jgi:hypothetical protein
LPCRNKRRTWQSYHHHVGTIPRGCSSDSFQFSCTNGEQVMAIRRFGVEICLGDIVVTRKLGLEPENNDIAHLSPCFDITNRWRLRWSCTARQCLEGGCHFGVELK